jgi:eukaryotic-like serine/threonine-protein kinase
VADQLKHGMPATATAEAGVLSPAAATTAATGIIEAERPSAGETRAGSMAAVQAVPCVGDVIDKYVVDRVIGSGGMGLVVAARNEQLNELVAIKLLRPKAAGDKVHAERFAREARAIVKIKSEHVVRVLDAGTLESGAPFIVMEYLVGRDLGQIVREEGALPLRRAVDCMLQVCEAVASAHAVGVVHRDLKPSNFFLTTRADGTTLVKVLDFGISKAIGQEGVVDPNLTETQAVFGSPTYMSPEQIRSAKHVDHRSDVWSLGVALFELTTGHLPFAGDNVAGLLASIVADLPFYPRAFQPDLPAAFEEVLLHCLMKDARQRVQSAAELAFRIAPFATPSAETHNLLERIDRLARQAGTSTTGPKLPPPLPGPPVPEPPRRGSQPSIITDPRGSAVSFGSTDGDLSAESPMRRRKNAVTWLAVGFGVVLVVATSAFGAYRLGTRSQVRTVAAAVPSESVAPAAPASVPPPAPSESVAPVASVRPAVAAPSKKAVPPPRHAPSKPTAGGAAKPVDPTSERY